MYALKTRSANDFSNGSVFFFSDFLYESNVVGTHLNCIDKLKKIRWIPTTYALSRNMKNIRIFYPKIFMFLVVKFSVHLNR